jgi:DNA processing protein
MNGWKDWSISTIEYEDLPLQLKKIKNCPKKLYYRGNWNNEIFNKTIGVVGSRSMTKYGKEVIERIIPDLVLNKISIISGFMYGVDSEVHKQCVEFGGVTIAVLGGGLNFLSPSENDNLYTDILNNNGLVISEYENDFKPTLWSFPQRNRIVSGLSTVGVLVIEAGLKSGSLITARIAKKQKKKIFAIPGPINSRSSQGTNWLIKENIAKLTESVEDILSSPLKNNVIQENIFVSNLSKLEKQIIDTLSTEPLEVDELSRLLNIPISELSATISMMAMKNLISEDGNKFKDMVSSQK